jgi:hypothetical protein
MSKIDWKKLQLKFWFDHGQTGIDVKGWCKQQQLNYHTARRYIKIGAIKESIKLQIATNPEVKARKVSKKNGAPFGSQNALKHGGYSKYFYNDLGVIVEAINAEDELFLCRTRIHHVMCKTLKIRQELEKKPPIGITVKLYDSLFLADLALEKNVATIAFITKKISAQRLKHYK